MQINLTSVLVQQGKIEEYGGNLDFEVFKTEAGCFPIEEKTPIKAKVTHTGRQVLELVASCKVSLAIPCARCLTPVIMSFDLCVEREIDMKMTEQERMETLDESGYIEGKILDVDKLMYNEILISWPMRVFCQEDCKGICSNCGTNLNLTSCDCDTVALDPRMAAISDIFSNFKEV